MIDWSRYPNFTAAEFACRCGCGRADMDPDFLDRLQRLRNLCDLPFTIASGFRCEKHNAEVNGGPAHPLGKAADIRVSGPKARLIVALAEMFEGIGIQQKGDHGRRFIHLDTLNPGEGGAPRPWIWSY